MGKIKVVTLWSTVVVDTNVLVSALLFGGMPGDLISLWKSGRIKPLASREIIDEYIKVLTYPKFKLSEAEINYIFYSEILPFFDIINIKHSPIIIKEDPSDDKFLHCAMAGKAGVIISGDQHLLTLRTYQKIKILTPAEFLSNL